MIGDAQPLALIVEDDAVLALMVEDLLAAEGFDTLMAANAADAASRVAKAGPLGVAVINLELSGVLAGQGIIAELRRHTPRLPVVVITGYNKRAPQGNLRGLGWPTIRLAKPEGYHELAAAVWDVIDQARTGTRPLDMLRRADDRPRRVARVHP
ncbi:response regulator [Paracraurococcus ruber]|uniref:Response regulatory domain-containing protein n=1 Tax=Paracraurococcus ruber TaxID=77675 RepID=A0ABS1CYE8_9PROT|nr:response regulator [Paracraurococcus ruber]MBK1659428.1 hypothetical protein [Paracraurococcus ruber]TDG33220.1 response regulator [Paracraurococcus ruber]